MTGRNLDIGFSSFGEEVFVPEGTSLGLDPETTSEPRPGFIQIKGLAERLPFRSNSLNRITSTSTIGEFAEPEESLQEVVRVLRPGGTAKIITTDIEPFEAREILRDLPIEGLRIKTQRPDQELPEFAVFTITFRKV